MQVQENNLPFSKDFFNSLESPYKEFYEFHGVQLISINFPPIPQLVCELYNKLKNQIYDSGDFFQLMENQNTKSFEVYARKYLKKYETVFLVDHSLSFRYPDLRKVLRESPPLISRVKNMLKFWDEKKPLPNEDDPSNKKKHPLSIEYEFLEIQNPLNYEINPDCIALSFYGNNISDMGLIESLCEKYSKIKVLWLNENPICEFEHKLGEIIESKFKNIEIFNSKLTKNLGPWAINFLANKGDLYKPEIPKEKIKYLDLNDRDIFHLDDFEAFKQFFKIKKISLLGHELDSLENTNKFFRFLQTFPNLKEIQVDSSVEKILWELHSQKKLEEITKSLRIINGFDLSYGRPEDNQQDVEFICKNIWKVANSYRLANTEQLDETSIWYINDELGTGIQHSDVPNVILVPFLFAPNNKFDSSMISYSLLLPIHDLHPNQQLFKDYLFGIDEQKFRSSKLSCWFDVPYQIFYEKYNLYKANIEKTTEIGIEKLKEKNIALMSKQNLSQKEPLGILPQKPRPLFVITDLEIVISNLKNENFKFTKTLEEADIIFLNANIKDNFWQISKSKYANQFPYESCIVMKNHLAKTVVESLGLVKWLQHTYDLEIHLNEFIGEFKSLEEKCKNNLWIIKPPNMARSMDMVITNNLDVILRLLETGPKLAQKYIHKPITLRKKKIDLRFIVLLRSITPLEVFLYKVFWIRTSNNEFSLDPRSLEVYETHFTVMNYGHNLTQIHYNEFILEFNEEYKHRNITWNEVYNKIKQMVKELFLGVEIRYPEMHTENARSIYGMDVMIDSKDFQPKLLEMTFSPDCHRACKYHPSFYDNVFECLYLHKDDCNVERVV